MQVRYTGRMEYWKMPMEKDLNDRLAKAIEDKHLKIKLEGDLSIVEAELVEVTAHVKALKTQLEKEQVDVERLEGTSLTTLFYQVLGSREAQLEVERQELLAVQLRYQQAKHRLDALVYDQESLTRRLEMLAGADEAYQQEPLQTQLRQLEEQRTRLVEQG